ncbi:MAG: DUF1553 domain-containing protein [Planctomycetes bacterium]|nr:DUF1553 domain-containing protein [Planctomycetota bacterium]
MNIRFGITLPSPSKVRKWLDEECLAIVKWVSVATSEIIKKIKAKAMPPRADLAKYSVKPVAPQELKKLIDWIAAGAPEVDIEPDVATAKPDPLVSDDDRAFWSFQPPRRPPIPLFTKEQLGAVSLQNPIDAFILKELDQNRLSLSPSTDRAGLIRRAYFDLIGLPPQPEEVSAILADPDPLAYERLVDRLLASPHYGERWGQYWLDLAGYCDSEGVQHSDPIRPHAWRYRDYVIRAFNDDKPYDRFLLEQIAGDELADYENAEVINQEIYDNLVATGFLRMSADGTFSGITGFVRDRLEVIDDQMRILSSAVMGLTLRCARCHSHKFDPIPQRDYYRMVALFKPAMDEHDWLKPVTGGAGNSAGQYRYLSYVTTEERKQREARNQLLDDEIKKLKAEIESKKGDEPFKKATEEKIKSLQSQKLPDPMIRALWDRGEPSPTYLLRRGDYLQPGRLVGPGVPSLLADSKTPFVAKPPWPGAKKTGNRLGLAKWLTKPDHPLTARVIVNRIWKHHFGRGIVETLDDFGRAGARPTHPELLDWLAVEFSQSGWSIKRMHRLIMTSATYRQSSQVTADHERLDLDNRLLSRMPLKRMEAEVLRDTLLAISGRLNPKPFGPADPVEARADGLVTTVEQSGGWRRSVYVLKRRTQRLTILDSFDRPRMAPNCISRRESTVAPQALYLLNNKMIHELSKSFAERVIRESGDDPQRQIEAAYLLALNRGPSPQEKALATDRLQRLAKVWKLQLAKQGDGNADRVQREAARNALANLCHAIMNSAALLYVD